MRRPSPRPQHRILHLTDTHLLGDPEGRHNGVDTYANLQHTLGHLQALDSIDVVALTGDLSEDGSPASYRRLKDLIEPWAAARGAETLYAMGNHDQRAPFRQVLGLEFDGEAPVSSVTDVAGLRLVVLDTSVPGFGYGELDAGQLSWLQAELKTPARFGTVVLMHHPPVPAQTVLLQALALQQPEQLGAVLKGTDVRLILSGHYHYPLLEQWQLGPEASVPVLVSPAITNLADSLGDPAQELSVQGAGGSVIDLYADGGHRLLPFHVPLPDAGKPVMQLDAAAVSRISAAAGPGRRTS